MHLWLEKGKNLGYLWLYFPALKDSLMSNMGLGSPDITLPIHRRQQLRLYDTLASQKGTFTRTAGM